MKSFLLPAAVAAALAAGGGLAAEPAGMPARAQLRACPKFSGLDFRKILAESAARRAAWDKERPDWRAEREARHARTRGPYASAAVPPADAKIVLRIWAGPGETQETPTETSSLVWLGADDVWRVHRVDHAPTRPYSPRPPEVDEKGNPRPYVPWTEEQLARMQRDEIAGPLEPARAYGIEAALADPCFRLQPDSMPFDPPVRKGKTPRPPCYGVIGGTLEIAWADGRRREVTELCGGFYAQGIIDAVLYARPLSYRPDTQAACDVLRGAAEADPTAFKAGGKRELIFCEAGLSDTLRRNGVEPARRDRLLADAARLKPAELPALYDFLSEWDAGALKQAAEKVEKLLPGTPPPS